MSWQQDQGYGGYSNYGNYGEGQYGGGGSGESATLDMFDDVQAETQQQAQNNFTADSNNAYYNPNAYQSDHNTYRPPSQQGQAYQRG